jgi:hypothetical protein
VRPQYRQKLVWYAVILLALLPAQLAIEQGTAYWLLPRQESATLKTVGDEIQIDHVEHVLQSIPLTTFTWHLLHVTQTCFVAGLALLVFAGVRWPFTPTSPTSRAVFWILLPVAVVVTTVAAGLLFAGISRAITDRCAQDYDLDISMCPAPWAGVVFSSIACIGSAAAAALGVLSAYAAAPAARIGAMLASAALLTGFALWLAWVSSSWQLLFAVASAFTVTFIMSRHHARAPRTI